MTTASSSSRSHNAPISSSGGSSSQQTSPIHARRASQKPPSNEHHPFRLEVHQVTPVSISMRWSLRPPPISELRHGENSAESLLRKSLAIAARTNGRVGSDEEDWPSDDGATAVNDDNYDSDDLSCSSEIGQSFEEHFPPNPKAVLKSGTLSRMFDTGVSVVLNGKAWTQVVVGDKGADEAVIVVYGLQPDRTYDLEMIVESRGQRKAKLAARFVTIRGSTSGSDSAGFATPEARDTNSSAYAQDVQQRGNLTPLQSSDNGHQPNERRTSLDSPVTKEELSKVEAVEALKTRLTVELRQARKEASKAEQALRNEIEGVKKNLERTSDVDHRSKQKVLALQESIRQANQSARDLAEEAEMVESEHPGWEEKVRVSTEKERAARQEVERAEGDAAVQIKEDEDLTAVVEKELAGLTKALTSKTTEMEKLQTMRVAQLEAQLAELEAEVDKIKRSNTPPPLEPTRWSRGGLEPHAPPFMPGQGLAGVGGGRGGSLSLGLRGGRQYREQKGPPSGAPVGVGGKSGPQRHVSVSGQANKRGRGGAVAPVLPSHPHNIMPVAPGSSSYDGSAAGYGSMIPYVPQDFAGPSGYVSAPTTSRSAYPSGLNPATQDFTPSSAHPSPVLNRNLSPMLPMLPGSSTWGQGGADFSPQSITAGHSLSRMPFRSGESHALHDSPTMGGGAFLGSMRESPTSSSAFPASAALLGPSPAYNGVPNQRGQRSFSIGSPDDTTDIFDPTSSGPPPIILPSASPSSAHIPGRGPYDLGGPGIGPSASPWTRQTVLPEAPPLAAELSPRPGSGPFWGTGPPALVGATGVTPTLTSSPTMSGPSGHLDDMWARAPSSSTSSAGGPRSLSHTSSLLGSGSTPLYSSSLQQQQQQQQSQQGSHQLYQQQAHPTRHSSINSASVKVGAGAGAGITSGASPFTTASASASAQPSSEAGSGSGNGSRRGSIPTSPPSTQSSLRYS